MNVASSISSLTMLAPIKIAVLLCKVKDTVSHANI